MTFIFDTLRHLICVPYSISGLHKMAQRLNIKRCWFHKDHYDIPKRRIQEIQRQAIAARPREIAKIIELSKALNGGIIPE